MSTKVEWFEQLRQAGFVDVDKWKAFDEYSQRRLLAVLRSDPRATELE